MRHGKKKATARFCSNSCRSKVVNTEAADHRLKHPLHKTWHGMLNRCNNPKNAAYKWYGGKGVGVCKRWTNDFWAFVADMGERPVGMTLDRIDRNKDYEPANCRWADDTTQQRNRSNNKPLTFNNKTQTISAWAEDVKLPAATLYKRLSAGWSVEDALNRPLRRRRRPQQVS